MQACSSRSQALSLVASGVAERVFGASGGTFITALIMISIFGAKLSHRRLGKVFNPLLRLLWKLSFSSTPAVNYEPWAPLKERIGEFHVQEYFFGCMFLAWGSINAG